ncbi:MAG: monomethylamine:corrinoid methyltransferase [Candidatus Bathyarchaeota archaeon]|nr:MAG: monomethylamine:corrinoid methyltransferase [Candidatus Bathyarchaeota archaeon]
MIGLYEVGERASAGSRMDEMEWNMGLYKKMLELVQRYDLEYSGPDLFLEVHEDYVDRVFDAAVDFVVEMGIYCVTSNRVINFTEDEVRGGLKEIPEELTVGEGKDARILRKREIEDRRQVNVIGDGHRPWPVEVGRWAPTGFAKLERTDLVEGFNFPELEGKRIHGIAMEAYAAKRELSILREVVADAGRPGMAITYYPISTRASTLIAPIDPEKGLRRTDGVLLSVLPDVKVEYDLLTAAVVLSDYGSYRFNGGASAYVGGFCGDTEGAIIEVLAKGMAAWLVYRDQAQYSFKVTKSVEARRPPEEGRRSVVKEPSLIWPSYVLNRALSKHTNLIRFGGVFERGACGEIGSATYLLFLAETAIVDTVLGCNFFGLHEIPADVQFRVEVSDATIKAGIKREEVKEILLAVEERIREKLGGIQESIPVPDRRMLLYKDFDAYFNPLQELYDFKRMEPTEKHLKSQNEAKRVLEEVGLAFS